MVFSSRFGPAFITVGCRQNSLARNLSQVEHSSDLPFTENIQGCVLQPSLKRIEWTDHGSRRHSQIGQSCDIWQKTVISFDCIGDCIGSDNLNGERFTSFQLCFEEQINKVHIIRAQGAANDAQGIALRQYIECSIPYEAVRRMQITLARAERYDFDVSSLAQNPAVPPIERTVQF